MEAFGDREIPLQVAVMGCVVNGPGEARDADLGIAAGKKRGPPVREGPQRRRRPRGRDGVDARRVGRVHPRARRRRRRRPGRHREGRPRGREGPRRAARRAGRRRQPEPSRRWSSSTSAIESAKRIAVAEGPRLPSADGQGPHPHPPGGGLPPLVPGRRRQGGAGRQRPGAGHDGHPALRLRHLGADAGRGGRPHQGGRRRQLLLPAVHPRRATSPARPSTSRASAPSWPSSPTPAARSSRSPSSCGPPARRSSASTWASGSRATATCRCC